ncbi:MAG: class I SAM-dependent methyltransferase [Halopenitus sp.]
MADALYDDNPRLYDAIQSDWEYDRDVAFVREVVSRHLDRRVAQATLEREDPVRLLEVGCGTAEHTWRLSEAGFAVVGVDPAEGMRSLARGKCPPEVDLRPGSLPALDPLGDDERFDVAVAIRGVVNHLAPETLGPAIDAFADHLVDGGVLIFDNSPLPPDGNDPALDVGETDGGDRYARVARMRPRADGRLDWCEATFTADDAWVNVRPMTPFSDERIRTALVDRGFAVETRDGYGPEDRRTVFVAVAGGR